MAGGEGEVLRELTDGDSRVRCLSASAEESCAARGLSPQTATDDHRGIACFPVRHGGAVLIRRSWRRAACLRAGEQRGAASFR